MKKKVFVVSLIVLLGISMGSAATKHLWVIDNGECVEESFQQDVIPDPSFETKDDCQNYLDRNIGIKGVIFNILAQIQIFLNSIF